MYVKKLKDHQIADIMRVISDPDAEVTDIRRPYTCLLYTSRCV